MLASLQHSGVSLRTFDLHELQNFTKQNEFCCYSCNKTTYVFGTSWWLNLVNICSSTKQKSNARGNRTAKI